MLNRSLTMLCLSLMRVSGWQMAPLPVPHGHAQCAISQTTARQAVAPQMCSYDHLSSEFQVCARHATQTPVKPSVSQRCSFAVAEAGEPAHGHGVWRASFLAAAAQGRQRVGAALQSWRADRGRVHSAGPRDARGTPRHIRARVRGAGGGVSLRDAAAGASCFLLRPSCLGAWIPPESNPRCDVTGAGARV